ncbi:hypothetical protein BDZ91DRAFT_714460 [Kalaharituber pfeilii]|nr:hypothetical protein BDZ91DRAFT_714460 [Kalaharituber pfeilii]
MSVPTMSNKAALAQFIQVPVSREMISYLAKKASSVIRCETVPQPSTHLPPSPPKTPSIDPMQPPLPTVEHFITSIVERSHVQVPTLMSSLVYLERLKARLPPVAKGVRCTVHRIFLASLILAAKNLNDSSPKNKHWARYSVVRGYDGFGFSLTEVNLMEKQLLFLLDWDLRITQEDLYEHLEPFLTPIKIRYQREQEKRWTYEQARIEYDEQQAAVAVMRKELSSRTRHIYSPSLAASTSSLTLSEVSIYTPDHRPITPNSGRSSRASERSEYSTYHPTVLRPRQTSISSEYRYPTPPQSIPSSTQLPELEKSGSIASSAESSPLLPPPAHLCTTHHLPIIEIGSKVSKKPRTGLLSRFFNEKQQATAVDRPASRQATRYA